MSSPLPGSRPLRPWITLQLVAGLVGLACFWLLLLDTGSHLDGAGWGLGARRGPLLMLWMLGGVAYLLGVYRLRSWKRSLLIFLSLCALLVAFLAVTGGASAAWVRGLALTDCEAGQHEACVAAARTLQRTNPARSRELLLRACERRDGSACDSLARLDETGKAASCAQVTQACGESGQRAQDLCRLRARLCAGAAPSATSASSASAP